MARTSRKTTNLKIKTAPEPSEHIYHAAAYVRLSVEGSDLEKNQESITMQQYMLESYIAAQPDMILFDIYQDNGESGTTFNRPGFERLMMDVRKRIVDCIVVKDDCVIIAPTRKTLENKAVRAGFVFVLS